MGLLKVNDMRLILVIGDRFSKYTLFITVPHAYFVDVATKLLHIYFVKYFGVPEDIVSD